MAAKRNMITFATDLETKERVRAHAQAAGVDISTYVAAAVSAAMAHGDLVVRTFSSLDSVIAEAEARDSALPWPPEEEAATAEGREEISQALDDFFGGAPGRKGTA
ncbi:hypothetical protein [Streptomyces flaveus]|uniref:hypothetical protein n=1 Tax=Streptomyces flaveus TaxID=66370 RepID=UPI00331969CC